jgi:5-amino-6-(5-phospho-D-ribitylamino)uracil phosphatase
MQQIRLIALDMDGTTISRDGMISSENQAWIAKARDAGIEVTFATGRGWGGVVLRHAKELHFTLPVVTLNGSEVWTPGGTLLSRHEIAPEYVQFLFSLVKEYDPIFWANTTSGRFDPLHEFKGAYEEQTWLKFGYFSKDPQIIDELWIRLRDHGDLELSNSHPSNIEVNPKGVNKASGLQVICDSIGILPDQIAAMGDSLNDIPMLKWAGLGIAMGNAQEEVKNAADYVTSTCKEDGVARAIEWLLKQS